MDTNFVPMGERRLRQIMDAVVTEGDTAEYLGLEAKSDIDPSRKGTGIAKIAKFILGMANRMPEAAAHHFEGYGVMVIGVETARAEGIPNGVESHELADRLRPYLGAQGPVWDLARLPTSDTHEVLFIIVDPPTAGHRPFVCRKDFQPADKADAKATLVDGAIYVRDRSQTRQARAAEVDALWERGKRSAPEVGIDFSVTGRALLVTDQTGGLETLFEGMANKTRQEAEEKRCAAEAASGARQQAKGEAGDEDQSCGQRGVFAAQSILGSMTNPWANLATPNAFGRPAQRPEPSDPEVVIRRREQRWWARWPDCRESLYRITAERIVFTVENTAASYLSDPQVALTISGAFGLDPLDADSVKRHRVLPFIEEPARGPYDIIIPELDYSAIRPIGRRQEFDWSNEADGTVRVVLTPSALRPSTPWRTDDDELVLVATDPDATNLEGTWSLTAEGIGERFDGAFTIPIRKVNDVVDLMREYLRRVDTE